MICATISLPLTLLLGFCPSRQKSTTIMERFRTPPSVFVVSAEHLGMPIKSFCIERNAFIVTLQMSQGISHRRQAV